MAKPPPLNIPSQGAKGSGRGTPTGEIHYIDLNRFLCTKRDSNPRPPPCKGGALTN